MVRVQTARQSNELVRVRYAATSSSTSTRPGPEQIAKVYDIQMRRQAEIASIDWAAEAALWGEETRSWADEVQQAGDEALLGDLPDDE